MINTFTKNFIDVEGLKDWLNNSLKSLLPEDSHISIIPHSWEAKGESRFFCEVEIEEDITLEQLVAKVVVEHSRGNHIHLYADDVVQAAVTAKVLNGDQFFLYYTW